MLVRPLSIMWITLATTLVYPTVDSGLTITSLLIVPVSLLTILIL